MNLFFRIFQHLLPDALALRIRQATEPWFIGDGHKIGEPGLLIGGVAGGRTIDRFFNGLTGAFRDARAFVDGVYLDLRPETTRQLSEFEFQFGVEAAAATADRRANIAAEWRSTGGQSPHYLQTVMQEAGFDIYIHEWFDTQAPHDPRAHINAPTIGTVQCGEALAQCGEATAQNNTFLANDPLYFVNKGLAEQAPPAISDDPAKWPYFLYWGAASFPDHAEIPAARRAELERKLLKICPNEQWLVVLVDYI